MKKSFILLLCPLLLLTGCGTYTGEGAAVGGSFGAILGSAIGGISGGRRGSDIGTLIGVAGGAAIGAAIGVMDFAVGRFIRPRLSCRDGHHSQEG